MSTPIRKWKHSRKGIIVGRVLEQGDTWTTIECTEPNRDADVGESLMFRTALAIEVPSPEARP